MPDPMTAAPSGWLTEDGLNGLEAALADYYWGDIRAGHIASLFTMARAALHHQAALEGATDLPLGEVIAAWRAVKKCTDEFLPEYPGACEEYKSVLHEQLNALEAKR